MLIKNKAINKICTHVNDGISLNVIHIWVS